MKLPKKFRFMSATWDIDEGKVGRSNDASNKKFMGRARFKTRHISVRKDMPDDVKKETLMHELMHVIAMAQGLPFEENQIEGISNGLMEAIRQNEWFGTFFAEEK